MMGMRSDILLWLQHAPCFPVLPECPKHRFLSRLLGSIGAVLYEVFLLAQLGLDLSFQIRVIPVVEMSNLFGLS